MRKKKIQVNFWSSYSIPEYILLCWCGRTAFFVGIYPEMRDQHALINLLTKEKLKGYKESLSGTLIHAPLNSGRETEKTSQKQILSIASISRSRATGCQDVRGYLIASCVHSTKNWLSSERPREIRILCTMSTILLEPWWTSSSLGTYFLIPYKSHCASTLHPSGKLRYQ